MGFWSDLWDGIKFTAKTTGQILEAGLKTAGEAAAGFEAGGPVGAAIAGMTGGISNISTAASRIKHYADEAMHPNMGTIAAQVKPGAGMVPLNQSLQNLTADAPDSVKQMAVSGARFHDGLAKTGSVVSAVRMAGGTPITQHLANGASSALISEVSKRTGFDGRRYQQLQNPAMRASQMLPTTSAYHGHMQDMLRHGGAEAVAVKHLARSVQNPAPTQMIVGGA